jgi:D-alanine-D-alanine ligase
MKIKNIGILYETLEDALNLSPVSLEYLHHWREEDELLQIRNTIEDLGFNTIMLGTPSKFARSNSDLKEQIDFIFTISCGYISRFRQASGAMASELLGIPYTGADPYSKILGQNKHLSKALFDKLGILTPEWRYIYNKNMARNIKYPDFPLIVKPACEGTSVGIYKDSVVTNMNDLYKQIEFIFNEIKLPVLVEKFIPGKEFKIGFIGNEDLLFQGMFEDTRADGSSMNEEFLHYTAKKEKVYNKVKRDLYDSQFIYLKNCCEKIYNLYTPLDYGVFDIRQDNSGDYYLIELNCDASLNPNSSLAKCCELNGMSFNEMIKKILQASFVRQELEWN